MADEKALSISSFDWIDGILPGWTDIRCALDDKGRTVFGWGADENEDIALCKAFAEVSERIILRASGKETSNGFAAHLTRELARVAAVNELIERDLFLCHFLTRTPFVPMHQAQQTSWKWIENVEIWSSRNQVRTQFFRLGSRGAVCAISGLTRSNPFGFVIGASFSSSIEFSAKKALVEAARRSQRIIDSVGSEHWLALGEFLEKKRPDFTDHGRLALHLEYAQQIEFLFDDSMSHSSAEGMSTLEVKEHLIDVLDLDWPYSTDGNCPYFFAHADSRHCHRLFLGKPNPENVDLKRLSEFGGRRYTFDEVNPLPHPFE